MLPMFASLAGGPVAIPATLPNLLVPTTNSEVEALSPEEALRIEHAAKIDAYFGDKGLPLAGYGMKLVVAAEANGLPWNLLPAIAMRESTGYKHACKSNPTNGFGYGGCKIGFDSIDHAIERVAVNLGGNNPKTAHYYAGKDLDGIINTYNPPSVVRSYNSDIKGIMADIEASPISA